MVWGCCSIVFEASCARNCAVQKLLCDAIVSFFFFFMIDGQFVFASPSSTIHTEGQASVQPLENSDRNTDQTKKKKIKFGKSTKDAATHK